jgi:hypothetical protein
VTWEPRARYTRESPTQPTIAAPAATSATEAVVDMPRRSGSISPMLWTM